MKARRLAILLAAPLLAASLSACVSVFPKSKPDQLYSFGASLEAAPAPTADLPVTGSVGVLLSEVDFPRAAVGDGILTRTGAENAYMAESRWVGPASLLFREALTRNYDQLAAHSHLMARGEAGRVGLVLRVEVRNFEAVYANGPMTAPVVDVAFRARLTKPNGDLVEERIFDVRKPASDNRAGPIVAGFDAAVAESLTGMVAWIDQAAAAQPPVATTRSVTTTRSSSSVTTTGR